MGMINQFNTVVPNISQKIKQMRKLTGSNVLFRPTPAVIMEFENIKKELKERVTLSPIDVSLPLHLYTDASTDGLSYFLSQEKEATDGDGKTKL